MSRLRSYASRFSKRLKQQDIDAQDDPASLSVRAFRKRLLDEDASTESSLATTSSSNSASPTRVAVYRPPSNPLRRQLLRIGLTFVAPVLAVALILWITFTIVSQNQVSAPVATESLFDGNVPVPAGVRLIDRAAVYNQARVAAAIYIRFLPAYGPVIRNTQSYISPMSLQEVNRFYNNRLVDPKPPPWQVYGKPITLGDQYTTFYIRSAGGQRTLEGLLVQLETIRKDNLQADVRYYDKQAQPGETVITLSKAILSQ